MAEIELSHLEPFLGGEVGSVPEVSESRHSILWCLSPGSAGKEEAEALCLAEEELLSMF